MEIFQLRYFTQVLEAGSISEAARQLHLSQPSLSFQIRKLEEELQVPLFKRSPLGTKPTAAGRRLYASAQTISTELTALRHDLEMRRHLRPSLLRVGAQPMIAACFLPQLLQRYFQRPKATEMRLVERAAQSLAQLLAKDEVDVALAAFGTLRPRGILLRKIFNFDYAAFLPKGHPLLHRRQLRLADLWSHHLLIFQDPNGLEQELYRAANQAGVEPRITLSSEAALTLLEIAAVGTGVALAPQFLKERAERLGLSMRALVDLRLEGSIHMAWRVGKSPPPQVIQWSRLLRKIKI